MIERMLLVNFQAHKELKVIFGPKITTIVGRSDVGKSAVMRAIRWLAMNRPAGDAMLRHGEKQVMVKLWVDDHLIQRRRNKSDNEYELDGVVYKAVAADVPSLVSATLNVDDTNFQNQHDPPFWLSDTPGNVAKSLNCIVNLNIIDDVLATLRSNQSKAAAFEESTRVHYDRAKEELGKLKFIERVNEELGVVEALKETSDALKEKHGRLLALTRQTELQRLAVIRQTKAAERGRRCVAAGIRAATSQSAAVALAGLIGGVSRAKRAAALRPNIRPLEEAALEYKEAKDASHLLAVLIQSIKTQSHQKQASLKHSKDAREQLVKESGGVCPICQNTITL